MLTRPAKSRDALCWRHMKEDLVLHFKLQGSTPSVCIALLLTLSCFHLLLDYSNLLGSILVCSDLKVSASSISCQHNWVLVCRPYNVRTGSSRCWHGNCCYRRTRSVLIAHPKLVRSPMRMLKAYLLGFELFSPYAYPWLGERLY